MLREWATIKASVALHVFTSWRWHGDTQPVLPSSGSPFRPVLKLYISLVTPSAKKTQHWNTGWPNQWQHYRMINKLHERHTWPPLQDAQRRGRSTSQLGPEKAECIKKEQREIKSHAYLHHFANPADLNIELFKASLALTLAFFNSLCPFTKLNNVRNSPGVNRPPSKSFCLLLPRRWQHLNIKVSTYELYAGLHTLGFFFFFF